jgi:hypothetical protein
MEDTRVPGGNGPQCPKLSEEVDEKMYGGAHLFLDRGAMYQENPSADPDTKGEWWAELRQETGVDDVAS